MARRDRPSVEGLAAWESFLRAHRVVTDKLDRDLVERHGLPLAWYDVLVQLNEAGGATTMGELADRLVITPSSCTRVIERMDAAGLVERRVDPDDGRVRHAHMTDRGQAKLRLAAITHLAGIQRHFAGFVDDDVATLLADRFDAMRRSAAADA